MMTWEKLEIQSGGPGPGKRWGHNCSAVRIGQVLDIFGGYGEDNTQTNKVHVYDTSRPNNYFIEYHNANGKRTIQVKITKNITNCYSIEMVIDAKPLGGVLFSNNFGVKNEKELHLGLDNTRSPLHQSLGAASATSDMNTPTASNVSAPHEVNI